MVWRLAFVLKARLGKPLSTLGYGWDKSPNLNNFPFTRMDLLASVLERNELMLVNWLKKLKQKILLNKLLLPTQVRKLLMKMQ